MENLLASYGSLANEGALEPHGEAFGEHGTFSHRQLYEEELHVSLILRPPLATIRGMMRLVPILLAATLSGCFALTPRLPSKLPPPNLPQGVVLIELSAAQAAAIERPEVIESREQHLEELATVDADTAAHVLAHRVVTGMRVREVLWALTGHPIRIQELGPPGGQILLFNPGRWFVRLGGEGTVVDAGRY
jgi:hypothetical protein